MTPPSRIGLLGGTFDPIHLGHLRMALEVLEEANLSEIWLVPAREPPHRGDGVQAPPEDRCAMVESAVATAEGLRVEPLELERPGPSFTIDTLRVLACRHPATAFALILGYDAFREIHSWREFEAIFACVDLVVTSRPPDVVGRGEDSGHFARLPIAVTRNFFYDDHAGCYLHGSGHRLEFVPVSGLDISSSDIRRRLGSGRSIRYLVPDSVAAHIFRRGLYGVTTNETAAGSEMDP